jgi:protein-S-isoprenylcysteine O-methyltransferase Ste14
MASSQPSGRVTGTVTPLESLTGWRPVTIALLTWLGVVLGYLAFAIVRFLGRARMEERALADAFGPEWCEYTQKVPPWVPRRPSGR